MKRQFDAACRQYEVKEACGKNVVDLVEILGEGYTNVLNGVTCTLESGYAVFQGEHTNEGWSNVLYTSVGMDVVVLPPGTYSSPELLTFRFNKLGTWDSIGGKSGTFTLTEAVWISSVYVAFYGLQSVDLKVPLVLVRGDTIPTAYEPYGTNGFAEWHDGVKSGFPSIKMLGKTLQAADSTPDAPQKVKGNNAVLQVRGRNLIDAARILGDGYTRTQDGLTISVRNGVAFITGTNTSTGWNNILNIELWETGNEVELPAGTYSTPRNFTVGLHYPGESSHHNMDRTFTIDHAATVQKCYIAYASGATVNEAIPLVLVRGSEPPVTYEPYYDGGSATAPDLYAVEGYRDEWDSQTGKGIRRIGRIVLDGTETFYKFEGTYPLFYSANQFAAGLDTSKGFYSHGEYRSLSVDYEGNWACVYTTGYLRLRGPKNITTEEAFKAWLAEQYAAGTPVTVCYVLVTPVPFQTDPMPLTCPTGYGQIYQTAGDVSGCPIKVNYLAHGGNAK